MTTTTFHFKHPANDAAAAQICSCMICTRHPENLGDAREWWGFPRHDRGGRLGYICPDCKEQMARYSASNDTVAGKRANVKGDTVSTELETHIHPGRAVEARGHLMSVGFLPSRDATTEIEFKSPIWVSFNQPIAIFGKRSENSMVQKLIADGVIYIAESDGAHINIGRQVKSEMLELLEIIRDTATYRKVFAPLTSVLENERELTEKLFGRYFNMWAEEIDGWSYPDIKYNWVNVLHDTHVEYRLPKYKDGKQYAECIRCCREFNQVMFTWLVGKAKYGEVADKHIEKCANRLIEVFYDHARKL